MDDGRGCGTGRLKRARSAAALLVLVSAGALAAGGPAVARQAGGRGMARVARPAVAGVISTVAGSVGGPGQATRIAVNVCGLAYGNGSLYVGDPVLLGGSVRIVNPQTGRLTTLAGTGASGPLGDGGPAINGSLRTCGIALDHAGNLVIVDNYDGLIRVVAHRTGTFYRQAMTAGDIYSLGGERSQAGVAVDHAGNLILPDYLSSEVQVMAERTGTFYGQPMRAGATYSVAGSGTTGYSGDGGPATSAQLNNPQAATTDSAGNLLIADTGNHRVRVVAESTGTFYGQAMTAGDIYTVAGDGIAGYSGDGGPATSAQLNNPYGAALDASGNLLIADSYNHRVRVVAESTGTFYGQAMTAGDIYTVAGDGIVGSSGDGGPATSAQLRNPTDVTMDSAGNLVIADSNDHRARVVAESTGPFYGQAMTAGDIYTVAGNGTRGYSGNHGPATAAQLYAPQGVTLDGAGNLVIADTAGTRARVVANSAGTYFGQAMTAGNIYTVAGNGTRGYSGDGGPAASAEFSDVSSMAVDGAGNLVIADTGNNRVRVVAASTGTFYGQAMTTGDVYTVAGTGHYGFSGDGGPATSARIFQPQGVAMDHAGNLVIADTVNYRVRVVAESTGTFYGQAMTAGDIYTVAGNGHYGFSGDGGPATSAELYVPHGIAVDAAGNLVIADTSNNRVRVVAASTGTFYGQAMTAGDIYTVAGNGGQGYSGDGGPATDARFYQPFDVAIDSAGNVVIADYFNSRVRVVAVSTGTFYGVAMTAGDIYTVAGNGGYGFSGDGGPATSAELTGPDSVAVDSAGNLVFADFLNNRVRRVTAG